jgi:hypothetical protein
MQKAAQRLYVFIIVFGLVAFGQVNAQQLPSNFDDCDRYQAVIDYLSKSPEIDKFFKVQKITFNVSSKVWLNGVS